MADNQDHAGLVEAFDRVLAAMERRNHGWIVAGTHAMDDAVSGMLDALQRQAAPVSRDWRPEVVAFAHLMEQNLRANDHKPGWKNDSDLDLFERLGEESAELLAALHRHAKRLMWGDDWVMEDTVPRVGQEAADVANFAMMIADVCGALPDAIQTGTGVEEEGWRPIDSAPTDGTDILVCVTHNLSEDEWETIQWVDWCRGDCSWPIYWRRIDIPFPPTHWRPLPAAPTPEDGR